MFDQMKNLGAMAGLMKDLPKIQAQFEEVKARLGEQTVEAESGGGIVRAVVNGHMRVVSLHVDQPMLAGLVDSSNPDDRAMAEDLIAGAVNSAMTKSREMIEREMRNAASELNLPIPPGLLESFSGT